MRRGSGKSCCIVEWDAKLVSLFYLNIISQFIPVNEMANHAFYVNCKPCDVSVFVADRSSSSHITHSRDHQQLFLSFLFSFTVTRECQSNPKRVTSIVYAILLYELSIYRVYTYFYWTNHSSWESTKQSYYFCMQLNTINWVYYLRCLQYASSFYCVFL